MRRMGGAFLEMLSRVMSQPQELAQAQFGLWQDYVTALAEHHPAHARGRTPEPVIVPDRGDRRFKDAAWNENELFDFIKQSYLLTARYFLQVAKQKDGLQRQDRSRSSSSTRASSSR